MPKFSDKLFRIYKAGARRGRSLGRGYMGRFDKRGLVRNSRVDGGDEICGECAKVSLSLVIASVGLSCLQVGDLGQARLC